MGKKTFCNYFVANVMNHLGYYVFNHGNTVLDLTKNFPMTANEIYKTVHLDSSFVNWGTSAPGKLLKISLKEISPQGVPRGNRGGVAPAWEEASSTDNAIEMVKQGKLVLAALPGLRHGHVCILLPGEMRSGKWDKFVPRCSNVGKNNFWSSGVNYAFGKKEPHYFVYQDKL